jgi:hypothetical protein
MDPISLIVPAFYSIFGAALTYQITIRSARETEERKRKDLREDTRNILGDDAAYLWQCLGALRDELSSVDTTNPGRLKRVVIEWGPSIDSHIFRSLAASLVYALGPGEFRTLRTFYGRVDHIDSLIRKAQGVNDQESLEHIPAKQSQLYDALLKLKRLIGETLAEPPPLASPGDYPQLPPVN